MRRNNAVLQNDLDKLEKSFDFSAFDGTTFLITGATGLIGSSIVSALLNHNKFTDNPIKVTALVRNQKKAEEIFKDYLSENLSFLVSDIRNIPINKMDIDYIIHGASQTSSKAFVNEPTETIMTALDGTVKLLELAKINDVKSFLYLSSMEVYGAPETEDKVYESSPTNLNTMQVRSSYPESKRMCENLCACYASEFGVPANVIRLTQTFGPGVTYNDGRVFAEFARCAIEGRDITLNTKGETKRSYLYTADAVKAIVTVLKSGLIGKAFNAANEDTYCSIYEMASLVADKCADNKINVVIRESENTQKLGYAPVMKMNLDTSALRALGWSASVGLADMFGRMITDMKANCDS